MNQGLVTVVGYFAMFMALAMFTAWIDQIKLNVAGKTGSIWVAAASLTDCLFWAFYGFFKPDRDWKIVIPNLVGVVLCGTALWTALRYRRREAHEKTTSVDR